MLSPFEPFVLNTCLLHISVACYTIFHFYILLENKDKSNYINNNIVFSNKNELRLLIKLKLKIIMFDQLIFRIYLAELLSYLFDFDTMALIWSIIYAMYNVYVFKTNNFSDNDILKMNKFAYNYILSFFVLINLSPLNSFIIHCYAEMLSVIMQTYLYNTFRNQNVKKSNYFETIEFANKKEVEDMLSYKKFD
jgi:hypothetical protein